MLTLASYVDVGADVCQAATGGPNIIFILADDLGFGDLGVNGQNARALAGLPAIKTPNIDALAAQSVSFTRMYSNPVCSPSRASLLTGFEQQHLTQENVDDAQGLRPGEADKTWAQSLLEGGYRTGMYGKWHLGGVDYPGSPRGVYNYNEIPTQQGFENVAGTMGGGFRPSQLWVQDGAGGLKLTPNVFTPGWPGPGLSFKFADDIATDYAVQFVRNKSTSGEKFAAYVALNAPHTPFTWLPAGQYANESWPDVQKQYAAMVSNADQNVGRILQAISDPNNDGNTSDSVASNTIVIFASDNGSTWTGETGGTTQNGSQVGNFDQEFFNSNGPYRGNKSDSYEGGIRTPFFVRWEGVTQPGSVNSDYIGSFADIYPTLAELAGQDVPFGLDGRSMASAITGQGRAQTQRPILTDVKGFAGPHWAVQLGDWKLIQRTNFKTYELYNIGSDPYETTNLANTRTDVRNAFIQLAQLEGALEEPYFSTGAPSPAQNVYISQYKYWSPASSSTDFGTAGNWSGGTQYSAPGGPEALYWNTAPSPNWLAKLSNAGNTAQQAIVSSTTRVLGMQIEGPAAPMAVTVNQGATLTAYNGIRVESGGILQFAGGEVKTIGMLEVRAQGMLVGAGVINGYQALFQSIPELQGTNFLQPQVKNSGAIDLFDEDEIATLQINGSFEQLSTGQLFIDVAGANLVDSISVSGEARFDGDVVVDLADGATPVPGAIFQFLTAGSLTLDGLRLTGVDSGLFSPLVTSTGISLVYTAGELFADFDFNGIVNGADLAVWRQNAGTDAFAGDANRDGIVDGADFMIWQRDLGRTLSPPLVAAVPEPSSAALALAAATLFGCAANLHRRRESDQKTSN